MMSAYLLPIALLVLLAAAFAVSVLWQKSRGIAVALAVVLPLAAAVGLYRWRAAPPPAPAAEAPVAAAPQAPAPAPRPIPAPASTPGGPGEVPAPNSPEVEKLVADLEAKLKADPDQWQGWALLGRVRMEQGRFADASEALARSHALVPDNDLVGVAYAEALLRASPDQRFPPEAVALLERAAHASPPDDKAVFFLGMHKMMSGAPGEAADLWESMLPRVGPEAVAALKPQIAAARAAAAGAAAPARP
jgi:cytochrome c-type biogenesis protein CcmH